jgi:hypothetical protein
MEMVAETMEKLLSGKMDFGAAERYVWAESLNIGREAFERMLGAIDDALFENRPEGFRVLGRRERKLLTMVGEVTIERRYYADPDGRTRFLLDELMHLDTRDRMSPQVAQAAGRYCTRMTYRAAAEELSFFLPDGMSHTTLMNFVRKLGGEYSEEQREGAEALFSCGELPDSEGRKTSTLYAELDGKMINMQGEEKRKGEVKLAITHEGWDERSDGEFMLRNKRVHIGVASSEEFARTHIYDIARRWDIGTASFVVGGDGAPMARKAACLAPRSLFQLDRFHIKRAIMRAFSGDAVLVPKVYELATTGKLEEALQVINGKMDKAGPDKKKELQRLSGYLIANKEGLIDYRDRMEDTNEDARGLGSIEGNIDKEVADRLSKRGMRWSTDGADAIGKVLELRANEILTDRISSRGGGKTRASTREALSAADLARAGLNEDPEAWLETHMPALYGPDGSKPWARVLRSVSGLSEAV